MITSWREIQKNNFTSLALLAEFLQLRSFQREQLAEASFPFNLPRRLAEKMQKGTLEDPLFKQFVPLKASCTEDRRFMADPVSDVTFRTAPKLLHKYASRVLLMPTSACAMHCRYCFRQNFPYEKERKDLESELEVIRRDHSLKEVILSGGDPLSLGNETLKQLLEALDAIPHLKRLRFHTRFPMGIPERIDAPFLEMLGSRRLQTWFVVHCNHPMELDEDILSALLRIQKLGIPVLTQTVLLKGVNDTVEILEQLFEKLVDHGIVPYYLHQLDPVRGSHAFEVPIEKGKALMETLRGRLSGYALPRYVQEIAGESSKSLLYPNELKRRFLGHAKAPGVEQSQAD